MNLKLVFVSLLILLTSLDMYPQKVKTIETVVHDYYLGIDPENARNYEKYLALVQKENRTEAEEKFVNDLNEHQPDLGDRENLWKIEVIGCSWYCGGQFKIDVSSSLPASSKNTYGKENLTDNDIRTAWVEGQSGYGIGEYILIKIQNHRPRITSISLVNGYAKNLAVWKANSRVKTLNIYDNDEFIATVNLKDTYKIQSFELPRPFPNRPDNKIYTIRDDEDLMNIPISELKLMIVDVYKGDKYDDTAISDIQFDGLDVHCLAKGTAITMSDGSLRNIETLKAGDSILAINRDAVKSSKTIKHIHKAIHNSMLKLTFKNEKELMVTADHPFATTKGWASFDPVKTRQYKRYAETDVKLCDMNTRFYYINLNEKLSTTQLSMQQTLNADVETYTLEFDDDELGFFANGFIVGQE